MPISPFLKAQKTALWTFQQLSYLYEYVLQEQALGWFLLQEVFLFRALS